MGRPNLPIIASIGFFLASIGYFLFIIYGLLARSISPGIGLALIFSYFLAIILYGSHRLPGLRRQAHQRLKAKLAEAERKQTEERSKEYRISKLSDRLILLEKKTNNENPDHRPADG